MSNGVPTKDKVKTWLQTNNFTPETISDPAAEFVFKIKRALFTLFVYRQNNCEHIGVQATLRLPKENENLYNSEMDAKFNRLMLQKLPLYNVDMVFLEGSLFTLYDRIFDDGFSFDRLYSTIKRITLAGVSALKILFSAIEVSESDFLSHYI
ncbi:MAG: hypothetical protein ACW977_02160 [Candidatus Thorarchaeota archaeon]|jgi:hypothetical protein